MEAEVMQVLEGLGIFIIGTLTLIGAGTTLFFGQLLLEAKEARKKEAFDREVARVVRALKGEKDE